jgi:hypothetical protein
MKMKKGMTVNLAVLIVVVIAIIFLSLSYFGVFNTYNPLEISGNPILEEGKSAEPYPNYPIINTTINRNDYGNYTVSWDIKEEPNDVNWTPLILRTNFETKRDGIILLELFPYGVKSKEIIDTPPIFYLINFTLDIKHEGIVVSSEGACKPQCVPDNGVSGPGAWYDLCIPATVKLKNVSSCPSGYPIDYDTAPISTYFTIESPYCCFEDSNPGEGWYNMTCGEIRGFFPDDINCTTIGCQAYKITDNISRTDACTFREYAVYYEMKEKQYAIFEQKFETPGPGAAQNTSINWFTNLPFIESPQGNEEGFNTSGEMLLAFPALDYVSRWNSTNQRYFGTAKGAMGAASIIIGSFAMEQGKPYFASIANLSPGSNFYLAYAGQVPAPATYQFKTGGDSVNYVSLMLNTSIVNASDLCDIRDASNNQIVLQIVGLSWWNTTTQQIETSATTCEVIPGGDFVLDNGRVYRFMAQRNASWTE